MSIYSLMKKDWKTYCLMCSIIYIEEMSKPRVYIQIKRHKDQIYHCLSFRSLRLKMKDMEAVQKIFEITKTWEKRKGVLFIGETFTKIRQENYSSQYMFLFTPLWLNYVLKECGQIPNKYAFNAGIKRINNLKHTVPIPINPRRNLFQSLFSDKTLAAGAFIISMDLECRGIQSGRVSLCMSERFKDFLQFMLAVARKYNWTKNTSLSSVSVEYSRNIGIDASPQFEFGISMQGLQEIYQLAGPLTIKNKDACINFNVERSKNYINLGGGGHLKKQTKQKILKEVIKGRDLTTTSLQFIAGVGTDVVLDHLHHLEQEGEVFKVRRGKRYIWNAL